MPRKKALNERKGSKSESWSTMILKGEQGKHSIQRRQRTLAPLTGPLPSSLLCGEQTNQRK